MGHHRDRFVLTAALLAAFSAHADQGPPVYTAIPTLPAAGGVCSGPRVQIDATAGTQWCCVNAKWTSCGGGGGGGTPGGSSGNLQTNNGSGGFGAYAGTTCSGSNFVQVLDANGAATCAVPTAAPGGSTTQVQYNSAGVLAGNAGFTFDAANGWVSLAGIKNSVANSGTNSVFVIDNSVTLGGTTELLTLKNAGTKRSHISPKGFLFIDLYGGGDAVLVANDGANPAALTLGNSTLTGNYSATAADRWFSATEFNSTAANNNDAFAMGVGARVNFGGYASNQWMASNGTNILSNVPLVASSFVGNASTATALSTTGGAGTFWANNNTWQTPPGGGGITAPYVLQGVGNTVPFTVNAINGQTVNLQDWKVNNVTKASITSTGQFSSSGGLSISSNPTNNLGSGYTQSGGTIQAPSIVGYDWAGAGAGSVTAQGADSDSITTTHDSGPLRLQPTGWSTNVGSSVGTNFSIIVSPQSYTATTGLITAGTWFFQRNGSNRFNITDAGVFSGTSVAAQQLSTAGAANQFWKNGNVWGQPAFSDLSGTATAAQIPVASTTIGGVKQAAACSAGNHVASIVAGELTCTADAGGSGAGGANTQVQWNNSGALAGAASFTWTNATSTLGATNLSLSGTATINGPLYNYSTTTRLSPSVYVYDYATAGLVQGAAYMFGLDATVGVTRQNSGQLSLVAGAWSTTDTASHPNYFALEFRPTAHTTSSGVITAGAWHFLNAGSSVANIDLTGAFSGSAAKLGTAGTTTTVLHGNAAGNPSYSGVALADFTANQGTATTVLHGNAAGQPTFGSVDLSADTAATVLPMAKGGTGGNLTGVVGGVHYSTSTTVTTQTAGGAQGSILYNSAANTPAWLGVGTATQTLHGGATVPSWKASPDIYWVTADRTTTATTAATTTDLTWSIAASAYQRFDCDLATVNTATSLTRFAVAGPASMTMLSCVYTYSSTSNTAIVGAQIPGQWATTCTNCTPSVTASVLTTVLGSSLNCSVLNGANAGSITIYFADSTAGQSNVLKKGSSCRVWSQ